MVHSKSEEISSSIRSMTANIEEAADYQLLLLDEITIEILLRLPAKSVMQCKRVCKTWRALIVDPVFVDFYSQKHPINVEWLTLCNVSNSSDYHFHFGEYNNNGSESISNPFKHSSPIIYRPVIEDHPVHVWKRETVCSYNGLIFFISLYGDNMFVSNPYTREYVGLPLPPSFDPRRFMDYAESSMASGFGYDSYNNEYKIVVIHYTNEHFWECTTGYVNVYTLGSGRWRDKGAISPKLIDGGTQAGVFLNGSLHWLTKKKEIVSFNLTDEEFRIIPSPPSQSQSAAADNYYVPQLGVLTGYLYVTRKQKIRGGFDSTLDIWVMDNIELQSWTRKFSIAWKLGDNLLSADYYRPLALSKSGKLILFHSIGCKTPLVSYDPETKISIVDDSFSKPNKRFMHIQYAKSLVSLKALGEMKAIKYGRYDNYQKSRICI